MNAMQNASSCPLKDHGTGWGAFARWLSLGVLVVLLGLAFSLLGAWVRREILRANPSLLAALGAQTTFAALSACGMVLPWYYFSRATHSAAWLARTWLYCFAFGFILLNDRFPLWIELACAAVWLALLVWTCRAWGRDWLERDHFMENDAR